MEQAWEQQRQFEADASHELKNATHGHILAKCGHCAPHPEDSVEQQKKWLTFDPGRGGTAEGGTGGGPAFLAQRMMPPGYQQGWSMLSSPWSDLTLGCLLPFESVKPSEAGVEAGQ